MNFGNLGNFFQQVASEVSSHVDDIQSAALNTLRVIGGSDLQHQQTTTAATVSRDRSQNCDGTAHHQRQKSRRRGGVGYPPVSSSTTSSQASSPVEKQEGYHNSYPWSSGGGQSTSRGSRPSQHFMGNGGLCGDARCRKQQVPHNKGGRQQDQQRPTPTSDSGGASTSASNDSNMLCDSCSALFTMLNRKKLCTDCGLYFCNNCVSNNIRGNSQCARCRILLNRPPVRADLMKLKVKDLQRFLISKHVSTKNCVEKKDLVELVINRAAGTSNAFGESNIRSMPSMCENSTADATGTQSTIPSSTPASPSSGGSFPKTPKFAHASGPVEKTQQNFPKSYVHSTHRQEWFDKMEPSEQESDDDIINNEHLDTPVEVIEDFDCDDSVSDNFVPGETTQVQELQSDDATSAGGPLHARGNSGSQGQIDDNKVPQNAKMGQSTEGAKVYSASNLDVTRLYPKNDEKTSSESAPASPKRFHNRGLVYLSELTSLEDLQELSVKQIKDILAMNRVNFKGVVEKEELLKITERLWRHDQRAKMAKDEMEDDELCKICMDNPVDCVMLECGHMCTCTNCGKQMSECPICRQFVVRVVRIFKS